MAAADQAGKGKLAFAVAGLAGIAAVEHALDTFPKFPGYEGLVAAFVAPAVPVELPGVEAIAQDCMDIADRQRPARTAMHEPRGLRLYRGFLQ